MDMQTPFKNTKAESNPQSMEQGAQKTHESKNSQRTRKSQKRLLGQKGGSNMNPITILGLLTIGAIIGALVTLWVFGTGPN